MQVNKFLPLKVIHLLCMLAAVVLCLRSLSEISADTTIFSDTGLRALTYVAEIIAMLTGIMYVLFNYTKAAAIYYKTFMAIQVVVQAIVGYRQAVGTASPVEAIFTIIPFIALVVLAVGKDLGKVATYIIAGILLICRVTVLVLAAVAIGTDPGRDFAVISFAVSDIVLAITTGFMVTGKYFDKAARGTN